MAKAPRDWVWVGLLFIAVLATRLFLLSHITVFDSQTYFVLRQAEAIAQNGAPLYTDPLSYSGRTLFFPPLFHYIVAFFASFMELELAAKLATSLCLSSIVIIVFAISRHLTKSRPISYIAALFAGFVPAVFINIASLTPASLSVALIFLLSYAMLRIDDHGHPALAIAIAILSMMASTQIFIFLAALLIYFLLLVLEKNKPTAKELEMSLFLIFLSIWFYVLLYKKAFFTNGIAVFWNNTPLPLLASYFEQASFLGVLYALGIIPLFLGIYAFYHVVFVSRNKPVLLYIGFAASSFGFLWLRIMPLPTALLFFSINMVILSAYTLKISAVGLAKTKIESMKPVLAALVVVLFAVSSVLPFIALASARQEDRRDIAALEWIRDNTPPDSVILGAVSEGHMISYFTERKNVADENFLFQKGASAIYSDISQVYRLRLASEAIRILNKHEVDYILVSTRTKEDLNITRLFYDDNSCFSRAYGDAEDGPLVYSFAQCRIGEDE